MWDNSQVSWFPANKGNIDLDFTYKPFAHSYQLFSFPVINTTENCPSRLYFYKYIKHIYIYIWKLLLSHFVMRQLASFKATICSLEFCQFIACSYGLSHLHFAIICSNMLIKMWNTLLNLIFQNKENKPQAFNQNIESRFYQSNHHKINSAKVETFHSFKPSQNQFWKNWRYFIAFHIFSWEYS